MRSGDPAQIKSALDDVRMAGKGGAAAAPVIAELLRKGLDAALTQSAIETLADTEAEAGSEAIAWYTHHRTVTVRRAAVLALTRTKGAAAVTGSGFVTLAATLAAFPAIPVAGLTLLLGVDRFMSEARAITNLIGNAVATMVIAKWDGALDLERARAILDGVDVGQVGQVRPVGQASDVA